jgi:hypothetical protein
LPDKCQRKKVALMSSPTYKLLFEGRILSGFERERVMASVAGLLKTDADTTEQLFSGRRFTLANQLSLERAEAFRDRLAGVGARAAVEAEPVPKPSPPETTGADTGDAEQNEPTMQCPKCGTVQPKSEECRHCGIIIRKYRAKQAEEASTRETVESFLDTVVGFEIEQRLEWGEILTGFEQRNQYDVAMVYDKGYRHCTALEQSKSLVNLVVRNWGGAWRPFEILLQGNEGTLLARYMRPFRFYFHRVDVSDIRGRRLGRIERGFRLLRNYYRIESPSGRTLFELTGPPFLPWTFKILRNGEECGELNKKWGGLGREMYSDADKFGLRLPTNCSANQKLLLLGAVFLIDFVHFEENEN